MADRSKYTPSYSFTGWQENNPTKPLPAPRIDEQFADISDAINYGVDFRNIIQRSDGGLRNGIVGKDQLASSLNIGFTFRGDWTLGKLYNEGDGVILNGVFYSADVQHLSTTNNAPEQVGSQWTKLFAIADVVVDGILQMPVDYFTGDGFSTIFPLPYTPLARNNLIVAIGGIVQPVNSYGIEGDNVVFLNPPRDGYPIEVRGFTTTAAFAADGAVETYMIRDFAVTTPKLAENAVTHEKLSEEVFFDIDRRALKSTVISTGEGLEGGADLSQDFQISLSASTAISLVLANTSVQPARAVSAGAGLFGGGDLSTDREIRLSDASQASLVRADTALQAADIADLATKTELTTGLGTKLGKSEKAADSALLNGQTAAQLPVSTATTTALSAKANSATTITAGAGLEGGGTLASNRQIALSSTSLASLAKADSALQAASIADMATKTELTAGLDLKLDKTAKAADSALLNGQTAAQLPVSTATTTALNSKANSAITITANAGLTGGGNLTANRTVGLNAASIASLAKADTALQAADIADFATTAQLNTGLNGKFDKPTGTTAQYLRGDGSLAAFPALPSFGALASKNKISVPDDIEATGAASAVTVLYGDGVWRVPSGGGGGGMDPLIYDPRSIGGDVFDRANMTGTQVKSTVAGLEADLATLTNGVASSVKGPASSTDGGIVVFDGPTGKLIKSAGVTFTDFAGQVSTSLSTKIETLTGSPGLEITGSGVARTLTVTFPAQVQSDWNAVAGLGVILNKPVLGTAASQPSSAFATSADGALARTAVQPAAMNTALDLKLDKTAKAADSSLLNGQTAAQLPVSTAQAAANNLKVDIAAETHLGIFGSTIYGWGEVGGRTINPSNGTSNFQGADLTSGTCTLEAPTFTGGNAGTYLLRIYVPVGTVPSLIATGFSKVTGALVVGQNFLTIINNDIRTLTIEKAET